MLDVRQNLDRLIKEKGETYAAVSRLLSRNSAYIQQFIKRGSPAQLDESDIAQLSSHFGVPEATLGGEDRANATELASVAVPVLGQLVEESTPARFRLVDQAWLRTISARPTSVSLVPVKGDAMRPTLQNGDEVLIERYLANERLRDGLYALRADTDILVRRIALEPRRNRISVLNDNPAYPNWKDLQRNTVQIVGRVIWIGKRAT